MFILIADDEKMIRLSLQSMLEELYPNEHMYIHASNGQAAIAQVQKLPPDIAFLDIRMPLMNGLEALETCRKLSPSTKWIILSGYADFEYAQRIRKKNTIINYLHWMSSAPSIWRISWAVMRRLFCLTELTLTLFIRSILMNRKKNGSTCSSMIYSAVLMIFVEETYFYFIMRYFSTPTGSFVLSVP